jgi:hypothetical protein
MRASEILRRLPGSVDWLVLFDLPALRPLVADDTIHRMFAVPAPFELAAYSHVILSSQGSFLAPLIGSRLTELRTGRDFAPGQAGPSVYERYREELASVPLDDADCLGIGQSPPYPPVLLYVHFDAAEAQAQAVFRGEPSREGYELLRAVGVEFLGGEQKDGHYLAYYRNHLPAHVLAGQLADFSRTAYCNLFFLRHGNIDSELERGLAQSASNRITYARAQAVRAVAHLAGEVCAGRAGLICYPPPPAAPFGYGDIVPLGFMFRALKRFAADVPELAGYPVFGAVEGFLRKTRQGLLWSYHTGGLATATDSALVLQGLDDRAGIESLEIFADGQGAYYPQLCSDRKEPGRMLVTEANRHWCQPDYATTCLVRGLRQAAGLKVKTGLPALAAGFANRSGLYFANPYMVDWALASALAGDGSAGQLREDLRSEILAGMNTDYSFGHFDVPLSTAFAVLSLALLGVSGRLLTAMQLRLLAFQDESGTFPLAIPFYSAEVVPPGQEGKPVPAAPGEPAGRPQTLEVGGKTYGVSLYADSFRLISTAVSALALSADGQAPGTKALAASPRRAEAHPRYRCPTLQDYLRGFALPPYVRS